MPEIIISAGPKKDIRDWSKGPDKKETEKTPVDLGEKKLGYLAEKTGVKDPAALLKLVKAVVESCMSDDAEETEEETE